MWATRVTNTPDFAFELAEMPGTNPVGNGAEGVAELSGLAPGANHGVQWKFGLARRCRLLELKTLHCKLHLIGHVMQDKRRLSQEKRCLLAPENSLGQCSMAFDHEPQQLRTRKKAGDAPHSKRYREIQMPSQNRLHGSLGSWRGGWYGIVAEHFAGHTHAHAHHLELALLEFAEGGELVG